MLHGTGCMSHDLHNSEDIVFLKLGSARFRAARSLSSKFCFPAKQILMVISSGLSRNDAIASPSVTRGSESLLRTIQSMQVNLTKLEQMTNIIIAVLNCNLQCSSTLWLRQYRTSHCLKTQLDMLDTDALRSQESSSSEPHIHWYAGSPCINPGTTGKKLYILSFVGDNALLEL